MLNRIPIMHSSSQHSATWWSDQKCVRKGVRLRVQHRVLYGDLSLRPTLFYLVNLHVPQCSTDYCQLSLSARYYSSHKKTMLLTRKSMPRSSRQSDHIKNSWPLWRDTNCSSMDMCPICLVWPKPFGKAQWKGGRRQGRQKKRSTSKNPSETEIRQHQKMDRPGVRQVPGGSGEQGKMEETGCEIICGAPTILAVKEWLIMMMMMG